MNTAGLRGYQPEFSRVIDGWMYVDMHSGLNTTLTSLRRRLGISPANSLAAAKGYDLAWSPRAWPALPSERGKG